MQYSDLTEEERLDNNKRCREYKKRNRDSINAQRRDRYKNDLDWRKWQCDDQRKRYGTYYFGYENQECFYCGSNDKTTIDHLTPKSKGGTNDIWNLVPSCQSCNSSKGDRSLSEFYKLKEAA